MEAGRLGSTDDLKALAGRLAARAVTGAPTIVIPAGTCGQASGANDLIRVAKREILAGRLVGKVRLRVTGCHGFCQMEPSVLVEPRGTFYPGLDLGGMARVVQATARGEVLKDLLFVEPATGRAVETQSDIPFFEKQVRTILSRNEKVDPVRIEDSIAAGGYSALAKVLTGGDPAWVVEEVKRSGLRGRGGAGFPTGLKWEMLASRPDGRGKFLVCNADEGDPGAYMDRSVLEGNPHSIIEGMLIGACGTGATEGVIYVRNEYPIAIKHLTVALAQARGLGLLGEDILGTGFSFDIDIVKGAGAFVCGEETALIRSIEGKMGEPRQRPPFPIQRGIDGRPTAINNVETWANVPLIFTLGAEAFSLVGTKGNSGTKIFSLVGKIRNTGLVEVPMGVTVREIVERIGGGPSGKARIKAVQTGGPSGGCIPAERFDLPIDYESLARAGSIMGSGGMIVMDENTCMVDVAKYFMNFLKGESCGKCFTCRKGTQRMYEILDDISKGGRYHRREREERRERQDQGNGSKAGPKQLPSSAGSASSAVKAVEEIGLLEELARTVRDTTMCGLGQTASNPVLSTLRYFRGEYERHVIDKRCDAFVCNDLVGAPCQSACPLGTEAWRYAALLEKGEYEEAYRVIRGPNPLPSICSRVCDRKCETRCRLGTSGGEAVAVRALKRFVTDTVDPSVYEPARIRKEASPQRALRTQSTAHDLGNGKALNSPSSADSASSAVKGVRVAVVGAGPAGLAAAHYLSLAGHKVTLFEAEDEPGGMLVSSIPAYRLPLDVVRKEIAPLIDENVTLRCGTVLGRDITIDGLFAEGFGAVFLAMGAHKSWRLDLEGEDVAGVHPSMEFLKAFNLKGEELARGRVGVIGGGNSAVDAARVALRQKEVTSVVLLYRRTYEDMPAYEEEIDAALEEGVTLQTLVSPVRIRYVEAAVEEGVSLETLVSPVRIYSKGGRVAGIECVRNRLGDVDPSGRRRPVPIPGTEFDVPLDTLIVAIGERPDSDCLVPMGLEVDRGGRLHVDAATLSTGREGVFAGGDLVTGPFTVVNAIAAGKKAAAVIDRYLGGKPLAEPPEVVLPEVFVEPAAAGESDDTGLEETPRAAPPTLPVEARAKSFAEIETAFSPEAAAREARRCLRCDLRFTRCEGDGAAREEAKERPA